VHELKFKPDPSSTAPALDVERSYGKGGELIYETVSLCAFAP
jgi:hypothetical protein